MKSESQPHAEPSCLVTVDGTRVPLKGVEVHAEVMGSHALVRVVQRYRNDERKPIEAVYVFPLPSDATLAGFSMTCNGRTVQGMVKERDAAFRQYDEAVALGHGAALVEQERLNVFTAQVGNLLPGEDTEIALEYLQRVTVEEGALRFSLPTLVAPRYIPGTPEGDRTQHGSSAPTDRVPDADRITPPMGDARYGLTLAVTFALGRVVEVESPSHALSVTREGTSVTARLAQAEVALDRDVVITAHGAEGTLAPLLCHRGEGVGVFALSVVPDLFDGRRAEPQEVVFLVDISGSMEGASLTEAKSALRLCLRQLREGDRFNLIAFDDLMLHFEPSLVGFSQKTLEQADAWVLELQTRGGTELLAPLVTAVQAVPTGVVVLLTDGQVGNEDEILSRVLGARQRTRVYSFGIGTNVSDALLQSLASQTGGALELIHPGERIDEKVVSQFAHAIAPRVTDLTVGFEGVEVTELAPVEPSPLIDGRAWLLTGRYAGAGVGMARLKGTLRGELFVLEVPVDFPERADHPALLKLWASERIRALEAVRTEGRRAESVKERIIALATGMQVASRYTSFVLVEERVGERRSGGMPQTRTVPVSRPAGWEMFKKSAASLGGARGAPKMQAMSSSLSFGGPGAPPMPPPRAAAPAPVRKAKRSAGDEEMQPARVPLAREAQDEAPAEVVVRDPVVALLGQQLASGLWAARGETKGMAAELEATAVALLALMKEGVTSSHLLYGAAVKKAVEALLGIASAVAKTEPRIAELALGVAFLVTGGSRTRGQISKLVAGEPAVHGLTTILKNDALLRTRMEQLAAG